ncbi:DTW domain-containing protein [Vibrio sp. 10N.286.49.B3]|uniref:tRNA-uridine aminocarboxypropyltransferase n=1 Tax=Vibrio sp. 10N.286.49.B3 TaxID=1880855 RepID=UPI000C845729|nr:DTW domain-containing protein [Vibrio sp. 10N.286.49.B3]PMH41873.1 DTW domain-containing protein [Vibrio sp. 10N.286.49.B3]
MFRYCQQCHKSLKACICQWIKPINTQVELIILQHSTEVRRPMGTARILALSLANSTTIIGEDFSQDSKLNALLSEPDVDHYILYPGEHSVSVDSIACKKSDSSQAVNNVTSEAMQRKVRVILLDGTWKKAFKMWQISTNLQTLPTLHLNKELVGNYRIRKAPNANSLSTVEAGYHVLTGLEPNTDFSSLITAFDEMIQFQINQMPEGVFERNYAKSLD